MTIADKIRSLITIKNQIKAAIAAKGIPINDATPYSEYPVKIQSIIGLDPSKGAVEFFSDANLIYISKLTIPPTPKIQSSAFQYMNVKECILSEGILSIGQSAFQQCFLLESVTLPQSLKDIGVYAFSGCTILKKINFPPNITTIAMQAFQYCSSLEEVIITGLNISRINQYCFSSCTKLKKVTLSSSVREIWDYSFDGCTSLAEINLEYITTLRNYAFRGCSSLKHVSLPSLIEFVYNHQLIFSNMNSLESIDFGDKVLDFPEFTINNAPKLTSLIFKEQVASFRNYSFSGMTGLKYLEFKRTTKFKISTQAFMGVSALQAVVLHTPIPPELINGSGVAPILGMPSTCKIYVPDSSVDAYKTASGWSLLSAYIRPMSEFVMPIL